MSNDLRSAVVIDYQNIHLVGADLFPAARLWARHESLVDPLLFAQCLVFYLVADLALTCLCDATGDSMDTTVQQINLAIEHGLG